MTAGVSVWAPYASRTVDLVIDVSTGAGATVSGDGEPRLVPMRRADDGWWRCAEDLPVGTRYGFSVDDLPAFHDPRALSLPDGPHGLSEVLDLSDFGWTDQGWRGVDLPGSTLYELHIGTFTTEGTFDAAIDHLDHLVDLGIDIVEVMPVCSFPGRHGWGYDGVAPWAVHAPYGGPRGLQRFVDACHGRGLGVFLDVVYNHLGPDGMFLNVYGPYFHDGHQTPWGSALNLDGPSSDIVRAYLVENALHWLRDYHLDGLRLDAVHELHDGRAIHVLQELSGAVSRFGTDSGLRRWLVAESDRNDPATVTPVELGGFGMDAQWADDVHHGLHVALTGETQGYYADFAAPTALATVLGSPFFHAGTYSSFRERTHGRPVDAATTPGWRFVASLQTHDQVGNRRAGERLGSLVSTRRLKCGVALLLTSPYTPMLFMGEEYAAATPWQYFTDHVNREIAEAVRQGRREEFASHGWNEDEVPDPQAAGTVRASTLDWAELDRGDHAEVLAWYKALLALRRTRPDLRDPDLSRVVVHEVRRAGRQTLVVERGEHRVAVNLGDGPARVDLHLRGPAGSAPPVVLLSDDPGATLSDGSVDLGPDGVAVIGPDRQETQMTRVTA